MLPFAEAQSQEQTLEQEQNIEQSLEHGIEENQQQNLEQSPQQSFEQSPEQPSQQSSGKKLPGKHRGAVTALILDENGRILSTGEDGFLGIWNSSRAEERFQLSKSGIELMALRPGKTELAAAENENSGSSRVTVWDYEAGKFRYSLSFKSHISAVNYSSAGKFLILSGPQGTLLFDSETGKELKTLVSAESVSLASTGRSERTMLCYQPSGILSYWDLETGNELQRFTVPRNIQKPMLFGNSRFLCGFDSSGLLILDAVTGILLTRETTIMDGNIFTGNPESAKFNYFSKSSANSLLNYELNNQGKLVVSSRVNLPRGQFTCAVIQRDGKVILGTASGELCILDGRTTRTLGYEDQRPILDFAVSQSELALVSSGGFFCRVPLDYSLFASGSLIKPERLEDISSFAGIVSDPSTSPPTSAGESRFLIWRNNRSAPVIIAADGSRIPLGLPVRTPLRSVSMLGSRVLLLNTAGTISIMDMETGKQLFSYSEPGAMDAAFIDFDTIIAGRSALTQNTPFITLNIATEETVLVQGTAPLGIRTYRGKSGSIYGVVINPSTGNLRTSIVKLNTVNHTDSEQIAEYGGEDTSFAMAESGSNFAATLGNGMAILYRKNGQGAVESIPFETNTGFPAKMTDGGRWFIVLDEEGSVSWHDNRTGKLLAVFRLYQNTWLMEKTDSRGIQTLGGPFLP